MADSPPVTRDHERHDAHDPVLIAALLDRDLPDADRAFAQARVAACPACAELHTDLVALAKASLELPTPARPRDFTLSSDVAAALARGAGELAPVSARLTGEMTDSRSEHAAHDRLLVANLVDRSVSDTERARAEEQLAACSDCVLLYEDLVALSAATRSLLVPARPRDFTLTPADAGRLRVGGWRRVLAAIGTSRDVFSRPLAVGLTTLGLAGLLVATVPGALTGLGGSATSLPTVGNAVGDAAGGAAGGAASNPERLSQASAAPSAQAESGPAAAAAAPSPAASRAAAPVPAASVASDTEREGADNLFVGGESSPLAGEPDGRSGFDLYGKSLSDEEPFANSAMIVVAALLLLAGLWLFGLRWIARRRGNG